MVVVVVIASTHARAYTHTHTRERERERSSPSIMQRSQFPLKNTTEVSRGDSFLFRFGFLFCRRALGNLNGLLLLFWRQLQQLNSIEKRWWRRRRRRKSSCFTSFFYHIPSPWEPFTFFFLRKSRSFLFSRVFQHKRSFDISISTTTTAPYCCCCRYRLFNRLSVLRARARVKAAHLHTNRRRPLDWTVVVVLKSLL